MSWLSSSECSFPIVCFGEVAKNNNIEVPKRAETEVAKSIYIVIVAAAVSFVTVSIEVEQNRCSDCMRE